MQSRLIVKNFGPIEFVDLDLRNVNVFIGPQASGKSALAKLFTIFKAPRKFLTNANRSIKEPVSAFKEVLEEYNIISFLKPDTEIEFDSKLHSLTYKHGSLIYEAKLFQEIQALENLKQDFKSNEGIILAKIEILLLDYALFHSKLIEILPLNNHDRSIMSPFLNDITDESLSKILFALYEIDTYLSTNTSLYIPSERNFINIIKNSSLNLLLNNVPIPRHILLFGAEIEKSAIKEINLNFLQKDMTYQRVNDEDRIVISDSYDIKLTEAASGIQSVLPILIPILSRPDIPYHKSFVIEEPELNLFPITQYELIKLLESNREMTIGEDYGTIHTYTTHSPYILSSFNNLLYANKVKRTLRGRMIKPGRINHEFIEEEEEKVNKIIPVDIYPDNFTAYQIKNGKAESIFDRETGLIKDNFIDAASDKMADDFEALMELMK